MRAVLYNNSDLEDEGRWRPEDGLFMLDTSNDEMTAIIFSQNEKGHFR